MTSGVYKRIKPVWNKGLKTGEVYPHVGFQKGHKFFEGGEKGWLKKGHKMPKGEDSPGWLGDKIGYRGVHSWVIRTLGQPQVCWKCKTTTAKVFDWSNISQKYKRVISDWQRLCRKCHMKYDFPDGKVKYNKLKDNRMLLERIESNNWSAKFAKKKEDINTGDTVTIMADVEQGGNKFNPEKKQQAIRVKTKNGERMVSLNQQSINILIKEYATNDAAKWIGKKAKILLRPTIIGGEKVIVLYLVGMDYELDEYGSPVNQSVASEQPAPEEELPTINLDEPTDEELKIEDVPF